MKKVIIKTDKASNFRENEPSDSLLRKGLFSSAIKVGNTIYVSGFVAINPRTGKLMPGGIKEQATQVMENIKAVLEAACSSMRDVVKTTVYLRNTEDFSAMNEVFKAYFPIDPPTRTTVGVKLPKEDLLIEITVVACITS